MEKPVFFFGTGNAHKLEEVSAVLGNQFSLRSFRDLKEVPEVEETETTLEGNACLKARAFFNLTNIPCFADDTGLEVEALNGEPGVYSARYAGSAHNAQANMEKLLRELESATSRKAKFRTVIAFFDGVNMNTFEGTLRGTIATQPRGSNGFGYDPVFVVEGTERTLAEHSPEEKSRISHRAIALQSFAQFFNRS